jgi:hypothetical protein
MATIRGTFEVGAGAVGEVDIDVTGMTPDEIAQAFDDAADVDTSLCHQCAHVIEDPQVGDLVSFTVDGVSYEQRDGKWVVA